MAHDPSDARWLQYLYEQHSPGQLAKWARSLQYFRFCRAYGGHANDGDCLLAAVRYDSQQDLLAVMEDLGIELQRFAAGTPQPVPGRPYTGEQMRQFPSLISRFPTLGQPGHTTCNGIPVFVWVGAAAIELSVSSSVNAYEVDEQTVARARVIEPLLLFQQERLVDPPRDNGHCVCPKYYPEFWINPTELGRG